MILGALQRFAYSLGHGGVPCWEASLLFLVLRLSTPEDWFYFTWCTLNEICLRTLFRA
jgi:hypothetical protein